MEKSFWVPLLAGLLCAGALYWGLSWMQRIARRFQVLATPQHLFWFRHSPLYPVHGFLLLVFWGGLLWLVLPDANVPWYAIVLIGAMMISFFLALCIRGGTWFQLKEGTLRPWILFVPLAPRPFPAQTPWTLDVRNTGASLSWGDMTLIHSPSAQVVNRLVDALSNRPIT